MQEKVSSREAERLGLMPYSSATSLAMGPAMTMATVLLAVVIYRFLPVVVEAMDEIDAEWKFLDAIEPYISDAVIRVYLKELRVS